MVNAHGVKNMKEEKMSEEMITITKEEYKELLSQACFFNCLVAAGVDNWDGYEYAQEMYQEGN